jgi:PadR family transcriptional regulator AphA
VARDTVTRFAVLGQLGLRNWAAYDLVTSMRRTLHWFWPRAESGLYAEARRLEADGLVSQQSEPAIDGSRRTRTVYTLTELGRTRLQEWLASPPTTVHFMIEPFLRIHLARAGTLDDLRQSIAAAETAADSLLRTAVNVAEEFLAGTHAFQGDLALRGLLFDGLWSQGLALKTWAAAARQETERWQDLDADDKARRRALDTMRAALRHADTLGLREMPATAPDQPDRSTEQSQPATATT